MVTGIAMGPDASSAVRLACNWSISSSRSARAGAAEPSRSAQAPSAWRHMAEARPPIRSASARTPGDRASVSGAPARSAICMTRSWERSSSGTIRSTDSKKRRSDATGACSRISRPASSSISRYRASMACSRAVNVTAASPWWPRSAWVAAGRSSATMLNSSVTLALMASSARPNSLRDSIIPRA